MLTPKSKGTIMEPDEEKQGETVIIGNTATSSTETSSRFVVSRTTLSNEKGTEPQASLVNEVIMVTIQIGRYLVIPRLPDFEADASAIVEDGDESEKALSRVLAFMGNVTMSDEVWQRAIMLADSGSKVRLVRTDTLDDEGKFLVDIK